jgi:hypothetical protein
MGLRETLLAATNTAFTIIGNVKVTVTYHHQTATTYNTTTGAITRSESTQSVDVVLLDYARRDIDGEHIRPTDRRALIEAATLTGEPKLNDRLTISSETWEVIRVSTDPISAHYDLQLRRP